MIDCLSKGMAKVAAKRLASVEKQTLQEVYRSFHGQKIEIAAPKALPFEDPSIPLGMHLETDEVGRTLEKLLQHASGKTRVSALLAGPDHRLIAFSWSRTMVNRTSHAEAELVHNLFESGLREFPHGSTLWITLRPCAMCSAIIHSFCPGKNPFRIRFLAEDQGPFSKNSCLYKGSQLWRAAGQPDIDISLDNSRSEHRNK